MMKKVIVKITVLLVVCVFSINVSSQTNTEEVSGFNKVEMGPYINLTLEQGEKETVSIQARNIDQGKINIKVKHGKLVVFLDDARFLPKYKINREMHIFEVYRDVHVDVKVTYKEIHALTIRGEEEIVCRNSIKAKKFKLKAKGECHIKFSYVEVEKLKISLMGENRLTINSGTIAKQKNNLYGENRLELEFVNSKVSKCLAFGENYLLLNTNEELKINSIGESVFSQYGEAKIKKKLVLGENEYLYGYRYSRTEKFQNN